MNDPYATAPLSRHTGSHEFRLVELQPSALSDPFRCILRTYTVDGHCPPYTALSYMWGPSERYDDIMLNGEAFSVGRSLWSFLRQMRVREQYGTYWIDAICIDQKSVLERNHQVQMMRQIYSNAQSVAVWLGDTDDVSLSYAAMDCIAVYGDPEFDQRTLSKTEQHEASFLSLCTRKYWKRVWIVQELLLAKDATIYCGNKRVTWQAFQSFISKFEWVKSFFTTPRLPSAKESDCFAELIYASPAAAIVKEELGDSESSRCFHYLMVQYLGQEATNILDKVYALHGLANDSSDLVIDYRISLKELLIRVLHLSCITRWGPHYVIILGESMVKLLKLDWSQEELESQIRLAMKHTPYEHLM